ncbi:hypothetical protein Srot_1274 [Segniliparus rotundus DSM 44985]|uniref:DSBA oxidoreductase n=1 Tax=Segniliparus rotundus (strain ATCC BAA-972 / CDC 1076 / CIP 108378 / DSM 44985 / JCM 13578) TaxID=640132 RepID=D6ZFM0_SEGRD|nr:hypothetical protein [Segniliparus rotundus]ADG97744.1 hypothetical protein Srot_1274 [Segniliparus rotundus DSM 44985]
MRRLLVPQQNLVKWCGLALAAAMAAASLFAIRSAAEPEPPAAQSPAPAAVLEEVLQIGDPDALQPIDLYLDFLDPNSATLIQLLGEEMRKQIEDRKLVVNLRLVGYLDPYSASASYSSRALIAMYLVTGETQTADTAWKFLRRLFDADIQPRQGALKDLSDSELADIARQIGAPESAADFIATGQDRANVDSHQIHLRNMARMSGLGGRGTPFATYRGRPFLLDPDGAWLNALVSPSSATPTTDAQEPPGGATGVNVPHQEVTPGAPITRPSVTLPPAAPAPGDGAAPAPDADPAPQDGTGPAPEDNPVSEEAPAPAAGPGE